VEWTALRRNEEGEKKTKASSNWNFGFGRINFNNSELNYWELKHRAEKETKYNN
jgi:uncharacterized protein involved in outer membrane biogenesis